MLKAFGQDEMLTRGCNTQFDPNWEQNWRAELKKKSTNKTKTGFVSPRVIL